MKQIKRANKSWTLEGIYKILIEIIRLKKEESTAKWNYGKLLKSYTECFYVSKLKNLKKVGVRNKRQIDSRIVSFVTNCVN